jgi:Domain of unknown function (DUF6268)
VVNKSDWWHWKPYEMNVHSSLRSTARILFLAAIGLPLSSVHGQTLSVAPRPTESSRGTTVSPFSYEFEAESSYIGDGKATHGPADYGNFSEINSSASVVVSDQIRNNFILRLGVNWERYAFDTSSPVTPIPDAIEAVNAVVGADIQLTSAILLRVEAHPGVYGSFKHATSRLFNVPITIGASYFQSPDLIFIAGLSVDPNSDIPVIPAVGVHWKVSDRWLIDGVAPRPQLQFSLSDKITLCAGADLRTGTYRMDNEFGHSVHLEKLNNAILDYWEVRGGGGLNWDIWNGVKLDIEGGVVPYRQFDFYRANFKVISSDWAPYVRVGLSATF